MAFFVVLVVVLIVAPIIISLVLLSRLGDIKHLLNEMKKELVVLKKTARQDISEVVSK